MKQILRTGIFLAGIALCGSSFAFPSEHTPDNGKPSNSSYGNTARPDNHRTTTQKPAYNGFYPLGSDIRDSSKRQNNAKRGDKPHQGG